MIKITEDQYKENVDCYVGICRKCGETRDECEPDAENYPCTACYENEVFGTEQLLLIGELEIVEGEDADAC